jgi:peptide/nickel transport system substrate-binding protein
MQTLAGNLGARIMCAEVIEQYGASDEFGFTPETVVGTGPYKLKSWSREEEIVLEGFDDYFGEKAKTRNVVFQIITDATARGVAVETGEIDICFRLSPSDAGRLKDAEGLEVLILPGHGLHAMMFNLSKPMIQDAKVRQAVLLATDVPAMVEALLADLGETPCVAPCSPLYFGFFDMGTHPYDAERSKALLAEAGYPDGIDLSMMVSPTYNKAVEMAEILAAQMAEANIRVSIEVLESAAFSAAMASKNPADKPWDMWLTGMGNLVLDFTELRNAFRSTAEGTTEPNGSFYSNPEIDELLDAAAYTTNDEARLAAYKRATEILWNEDPGALWLNYRKNVFAIRDTVENFRCNAGSESNLYEVLVRAQ